MNQPIAGLSDHIIVLQVLVRWGVPVPEMPRGQFSSVWMYRWGIGSEANTYMPGKYSTFLKFWWNCHKHVQNERKSGIQVSLFIVYQFSVFNSFLYILFLVMYGLNENPRKDILTVTQHIHKINMIYTVLTKFQWQCIWNPSTMHPSSNAKNYSKTLELLNGNSVASILQS